MQILIKITSICKGIQAYVYLLNPSPFLGRILTLHPSSHQPFSFSHLKKIVPTQIHENLSHPWTNFDDFDSGCIKILRDSDFVGFKWKFDRNFFKKLSKKSLLWFFEHPPSTAATHIQPTRQTQWVPSKKTLITEQHKSFFSSACPALSYHICSYLSMGMANWRNVLLLPPVEGSFGNCTQTRVWTFIMARVAMSQL